MYWKIVNHLIFNINLTIPQEIESLLLPHFEKNVSNEYTHFGLGTQSIYFIKDTWDFPEDSNLPEGILIAEYVLQTKKEVIEARLKSIFGVNNTLPARVCKVKPLNKPEAFAFLEKYHLYGGTKSERQFGLYLPESHFRLLPSDFERPESDLLLSVITFANPRNFKGAISSHELIRYAVFPGFNVVGGLSKLLSAYAQLYRPDEIMTYIDGDWSSGEGFEKAGFQAVTEFLPYRYSFDNNGKRIRTKDQTGYVSRGNMKMKKFFSYD